MKIKLIVLTCLIALSNSAFAQNTPENTEDCMKEIREKIKLTPNEEVVFKGKKCEMTLFLNKQGLVNGVTNVRGEPDICYRVIMKSNQVKCNKPNLKRKQEYEVFIVY